MRPSLTQLLGPAPRLPKVCAHGVESGVATPKRCDSSDRALGKNLRRQGGGVPATTAAQYNQYDAPDFATLPSKQIVATANPVIVNVIR